MVDSTPLISDGKGKKQGHRILGCVDSRKAVLLFNGLILVLYFPLLVYWSMNFVANILNIVQICVSMLVYSFVIQSALKFNQVAVIVGIFWAIIVIVATTAVVVMARDVLAQNLRTTGAIITIGYCTLIYFLNVLIIYANSVYVVEVRKGIMSRETFYREKYSW